MWKDKYQLIGIKPGKVVLSNGKTIDFADPDLPLEQVDAAYKSGIPYLRLKGKKQTEEKDTASQS